MKRDTLQELLIRAANVPKSCSSHLIYPVILLSHTAAKWNNNTYFGKKIKKTTEKKLQRGKMRVFLSTGVSEAV